MVWLTRQETIFKHHLDIHIDINITYLWPSRGTDGLVLDTREESTGACSNDDCVFIGPWQTDLLWFDELSTRALLLAACAELGGGRFEIALVNEALFHSHGAS